MAVPLRKAAGGYEAYVPDYGARRKTQEPQKKQAVSNKRLVRRQVKSNAEFRRAIAWVFLAMAAVLFLMGISYTFVKAAVSHFNYQINSVQQENELIAMENEKLRGQIAQLRSLDRIEMIAAEEMGLIKNQAVEYMVLSSTIVEEGKVKAAEAEEEEEQESITPLMAAIDFLLSWKN